MQGEGYEHPQVDRQQAPKSEAMRAFQECACLSPFRTQASSSRFVSVSAVGLE